MGALALSLSLSPFHPCSRLLGTSQLSCHRKLTLFSRLASLDTVEDLLLYTPPVVDGAPNNRYKRQQLSRSSSTGYDRLGNLTPQEVALACEQAAAYIFETRIAYGSALDLLQEEHWLSLGDPILDTALGGNGFMTRGITEIAGERFGCRIAAHSRHHNTIALRSYSMHSFPTVL